MKILFYHILEFILIGILFGVSFKTNVIMMLPICAAVCICAIFIQKDRFSSKSFLIINLMLILISIGRFFTNYYYGEFSNFIIYYAFFLIPILYCIHNIYSYIKYPGISIVIWALILVTLYTSTSIFSWNQYQSVGNLLALSVLVLIVNYRLYGAILLSFLSLKIPSLQSLLIIYLSIIIRAKQKLDFISIIFLCVVCAIIFAIADLYKILDPRHFSALARLAERVFIIDFYIHEVRLLPRLDWQNLSLERDGNFITNRPHGVWLQILINYGWMFGIIINYLLIVSVFKFIDWSVFILPYFIPFVVSTDVNPLKILIVAAIILSATNKKKMCNLRGES